MTPEDTNGVAVRLRRLTKVYRAGATAVPALRGVDLEIHKGEMFMLVGPSGSGKTTLISVMAGILDQTDGECVIFDHDLRHMRPRDKTRYRGETIGFVFQSFNLLPSLSAEENVCVPLLIGGMKLRDARPSAREVLARVGFDERMMRSLPAMLSGGQQQRVVIARAIVHRPRLIVCDEPTSALDRDRALVVVTHDARIFEFADRIAEMDDGRIVRVGARSATGGPSHGPTAPGR